MKRTEQQSVMIDGHPLSQAYIPSRLVGREAQLKELATCLAPVLNGHDPIHEWAYGPPGTGKTAAVSHILRQVREKVAIQVAHVNCWAKATFFEIVDEIVTQLRILRAEQHRTSVKLDKLGRHLGGRPFILVLDEVDRIKPSERSATLYTFASLDKVQLVCIASSLDALFELDERARSRLTPHTVLFPAYSEQELKEMLAFRAEMGLTSRACSGEALARIAKAAAGDARVAIGTLRAAAQLAEEAHLDKIALSGLEKQWRATINAKRAQVLNGLTEDHRILHDIIAERGQVVSGELWQEYLRRCEKRKRKPLAMRTFSNYANRLVEIGLVKSEPARVKGKVRLFGIVE